MTNPPMLDFGHDAPAAAADKQFGAELLAGSVDAHALLRIRCQHFLAAFDQAMPSGLIDRALIRQADAMRLLLGRS